MIDPLLPPLSDSSRNAKSLSPGRFDERRDTDLRRSHQGRTHVKDAGTRGDCRHTQTRIGTQRFRIDRPLFTFMVRRGSTVRVRQRALFDRRTARKRAVFFATSDTVEHLPVKEGSLRGTPDEDARRRLEQADFTEVFVAPGVRAWPWGQVLGLSWRGNPAASPIVAISRGYDWSRCRKSTSTGSRSAPAATPSASTEMSSNGSRPGSSTAIAATATETPWSSSPISARTRSRRPRGRRPGCRRGPFAGWSCSAIGVRRELPQPRPHDGSPSVGDRSGSLPSQPTLALWTIRKKSRSPWLSAWSSR